MRIALLAMVEPAAPGVDQARGYLRVGGRTIVHHQLEVALALDCRRIVCLALRLAPPLAGLREDALALGAELEVASGARAVAAQVTSTDELFVFAEGLLAPPQVLRDLLADGGAVLAQPIAAGLAAGFERIDAERAGGGAIRMSGALVGRLCELPDDCDVPSALLRIALQAQVPIRDIPADARAGGRWTLVRDEDDAQAVESRWIALHLGVGRGATLSEKAARAAIGAYGSSLLHGGSDSRILAAGVGVLLVLALAVGWLGIGVAAFVLLALAVLLGQGAAMLARVEGTPLRQGRAKLDRMRALGWLIDANLILLAILLADDVDTDGPRAAAAFAPIMLVCVVRMLPRVLARRWVRWLEDRATIALVLAAGAGLDLLTATVEALAMLIAVAALALAPRP